MTFEHGDIVVVPFPFTNLRGKKRRPALVLSSKSYNAGSSDILVAGMTSNMDNTGHSVLVTGRDLVDGTLPVDSRVKLDKIATLNKPLARRIGRLRPGLLGQVYKELLAILPPEARP